MYLSAWADFGARDRLLLFGFGLGFTDTLTPSFAAGL